MITDPVLASDISYNPASACFEAKVTVHGAGTARVYACEVNGDLSLTDTDIQTALQTEARRRHMGRPGLCSTCHPSEPRPMHEPRRAAQPVRWLDRLQWMATPRVA